MASRLGSIGSVSGAPVVLARQMWRARSRRRRSQRAP
jgi:hypothetical protein